MMIIVLDVLIFVILLLILRPGEELFHRFYYLFHGLIVLWKRKHIATACKLQGNSHRKSATFKAVCVHET